MTIRKFNRNSIDVGVLPDLCEGRFKLSFFTLVVCIMCMCVCITVFKVNIF